MREWDVTVAAPATLAASLQENYELAMLFRDLATLRTDILLFKSVDLLRWRGPTRQFAELGTRLDPAAIEKESRKSERNGFSKVGAGTV